MAVGAVTYVAPVAGAVAPTAAQVLNSNEVVADVVFGAGDTVATITHNMALSVAGADGTPDISFTVTASGTALNMPVLAVNNANSITIAQVLGSANTGATYRVRIRRPHSMVR
jgi:hypothetical protein